MVAYDLLFHFLLQGNSTTMIHARITGIVIDRLTNTLGLRPVSKNSQDWEAEVADSSKLHEYLSFYEAESLSDDEKFALMSLILYALESAEKLALPDLVLVKKRIEVAIRADLILQSDYIAYWSLPDEDSTDPDELFLITPFIRNVATALHFDYKQFTSDRSTQ